MKLLQFPLLTLSIPTLLLSSISIPASNNLDAAAQNPTLQSVFRERLVTARSITDNYGRKRFRGNLNMLEMQVNSATRSFLEDLEEELATLESCMKDVEEFAEEPQLEGGSKKANESWRISLDRLVESADDLRDSLKTVIDGLAEKERLDSSDLGEQWASKPRRQVIDWLDTSVATISKEVTDYFFSSNHTVSLTELREESMLVKLDRLTKLARYLKEDS